LSAVWSFIIDYVGISKSAGVKGWEKWDMEGRKGIVFNGMILDKDMRLFEG
jgi:hypothetical protein